jgi:hypothetical protein
VWGVFTYDSARLLFRAMEKAAARALPACSGFSSTQRTFAGRPGASLSTPPPAYREKLPFLNILNVDAKQNFVIAP